MGAKLYHHTCSGTTSYCTARGTTVYFVYALMNSAMHFRSTSLAAAAFAVPFQK